jgi:hypothetical protein
MCTWREVEMKRRERLLNKQLLEAELATVAAQREATSQAAKQAKYMFWSTVFAGFQHSALSSPRLSHTPWLSDLMACTGDTTEKSCRTDNWSTHVIQ